VNVQCLRAQYDPVNEQARWSYWVGLKNKQQANATRAYEFHLTSLDRKVTNHLDRTFGRDEGPVVSLQEFKLDVLRADLHVPAGSVSFPCAESLSAPGRRTGRIRSGVYTVHRTYTGDVTIKGLGPYDVQFIPVRVSFEVGFVLSDPDDMLASEEDRENSRRQLEWVRVADRCETCRPLIICESLRQPGSAASTIPSADQPPYDASNTSHVHVMAGVEKRPVIVNPTLTERKRTVACTRWSPLDGTPGNPVFIDTDSTEQGLAPATPYLTFHHAVPVTSLSRGSWRVELLLGEMLDAWDDREPVSGSPEERQNARQRDARVACEQGDPVFSQIIKVP
jgi:hypothetical protein